MNNFAVARNTSNPPPSTSSSGQKQSNSSSTPALANIPLGPLKGKVLDDIIQKWQSELDESVRIFHQKAKQISDWDRSLMENAQKIAEINDYVNRSESQQKELDQNLDYIESQQSELSNLLDMLENEILGLSQQSSTTSNAVEDQRHKTYLIAEGMNQDLSEMTDQLNQLVEKIKQSDNQESQSSNPVTEIVKILNNHLDTLQLIDRSTIDLQDKWRDLEKQCASQKLDHERLHINM